MVKNFKVGDVVFNDGKEYTIKDMDEFFYFLSDRHGNGVTLLKSESELKALPFEEGLRSCHY